jgi:hypothetical protein
MVTLAAAVSKYRDWNGYSCNEQLVDSVTGNGNSCNSSQHTLRLETITLAIIVSELPHGKGSLLQQQLVNSMIGNSCSFNRS